MNVDDDCGSYEDFNVDNIIWQRKAALTSIDIDCLSEEADKYCHCLFEGGSRGAEDLILPGTGGAGSRPNIRGLNVAVSRWDIQHLVACKVVFQDSDPCLFLLLLNPLTRWAGTQLLKPQDKLDAWSTWSGRNHPALSEIWKKALL